MMPARLCYRNLLYTGVTRARKLLCADWHGPTEQAMVENRAPEYAVPAGCAIC